MISPLFPQNPTCFPMSLHSFHLCFLLNWKLGSHDLIPRQQQYNEDFQCQCVTLVWHPLHCRVMPAQSNERLTALGLELGQIRPFVFVEVPVLMWSICAEQHPTGIAERNEWPLPAPVCQARGWMDLLLLCLTASK